MKLGGLAVIGALAWLGCSKEGSSASPAAGPAGVVVELSGTVEATREGGEPRPLAVDAEVFADDTIKTGADSSVNIALTHNNASLRLEAGMTKRVDSTLAWKAPRREDDSVLDRDVDDQTAAAGRHTEREAAGTASTAVANAEPEREAAPAPAPEPPPVKKASPPKKKSRPRPRKRSSSSSSTPPSRGFEGGLMSDSAPARPAPAPVRTGGAQESSTTRGGPVDVKKLMSSRIKVCHALAEDAPAGRVTAVIQVSAAGKVKVLKVKGSDAALDAVVSCARDKIAKLAVGAAKPGVYHVTLTLR